MDEIVARFLEEMEVDAGQTSGPMTVFPVRGRSTSKLAYRVLSEALADGDVVVDEREQAAVPELVLVNRGELPVFVLDGEEVIGGRQNRLANASMLIGARTKTVLPVSCVERGRWHERGSGFSSGEASILSLRREKEVQVQRSMRMTSRPLTDQGAIWAHIEEKRQQADASTPTGAMHDIYQHRAASLEDSLRAFPYVPGASGAVVAIGGHVACTDVFDQPSTARALWARLVRSYAMDALDSTEPKTPVTVNRARRLLVRARAAHSESYPSVGLGEDVRLAGRRFIGSALTYQGTVVHLAIFRSPESGHDEEGGLARASMRRQQLRSRLPGGDTTTG